MSNAELLKEFGLAPDKIEAFFCLEREERYTEQETLAARTASWTRRTASVTAAQSVAFCARL